MYSDGSVQGHCFHDSAVPTIAQRFVIGEITIPVTGESARWWRCFSDTRAWHLRHETLQEARPWPLVCRVPIPESRNAGSSGGRGRTKIPPCSPPLWSSPNRFE